MKDVMILTGAGQIGMAIARRIGTGMKIVIGDKKLENAQAISQIMNEAGFDTVPVETDLSSRESILNIIAEAREYGEISMLVNAAGVSPSQAPVEAILKVDLYGTAVLLEEVGKVIKQGGVGVTISSQSGWRMPALTAYGSTDGKGQTESSAAPASVPQAVEDETESVVAEENESMEENTESSDIEQPSAESGAEQLAESLDNLMITM